MATINQIDDSRFTPEVASGIAGPDLYKSNRAALRVLDEQDAVMSGNWVILPPGISFDLPERILYYRGTFAWFKLAGEWVPLPYSGRDIDVFGRWQFATPIPFNGSNEIGKKEIKPLFENKWYRCIYDVQDVDSDLNPEEVCVICYDYSRQISQNIIPKAKLMDPLLSVIAECIPFARTSLINATGVQGVKIVDETKSSEVYRAGSAAHRAALDGVRWIPLAGDLNTSALPSNSSGNVQDFLLAAQSFDNYRLSLHGLENGGLFQKKQHLLGSEQAMNENKSSRVLENRTKLRQESCTILNSIEQDIIVWYEPNKNPVDYGQIYEPNEQTDTEVPIDES